MKTYIQHKLTGNYLDSLNGWVATERKALEFQTPANAIAYVHDMAIEDVQLVIVYKNTGNRILLPVQPRDSVISSH